VADRHEAILLHAPAEIRRRLIIANGEEVIHVSTACREFYSSLYTRDTRAP
jgi:hypothetical protein